MGRRTIPPDTPISPNSAPALRRQIARAKPKSTHNYFRPHPQGEQDFLPKPPVFAPFENRPLFLVPRHLMAIFRASSGLFPRCSGMPGRPCFGEGNSMSGSASASSRPQRQAHLRAGQGRQRDGGRRRADCGAVDDQHRHRRRRRHGAPGRGARPRRLRDRPHHRRPRRGRRGRAEDQGAAPQDGRRRADRRRLPLHRPQAARRPSRLRRGARQVPHQPRQRRLQGQEGQAVLRHRRDGDQARQAGAHRRQLGLARPGIAHAPDGREHQVAEPAGRARDHARGDDPVGAALRAARRGDRAAAQQDHPLGEGLRGAGPDRGLSGSRPPLRLRHPPRPHRSRHGIEGHRRLLRRARHPACRRASATPSASR